MSQPEISNEVARTIGKLVRDYFKEAKANGQECRLLIPGLTEAISKEVQAYLKSQKITSYLVVNKKHKPNEEMGWLYADGLTSLRHGSMAIVASPGELAYIQDSIKGPGGTIRSIAYSDEWPWVDNENESFQFKGPFLRKLLLSWSDDEQERKWLRTLILEGLLPDTSDHLSKASFLLDEILGSFTPDLYPEITDIREKFLFHCDIPYPDQPAPDCRKLISKVRTLCEGISGSNKELGTRSEILDRVDEVRSDEDEILEIRDALNVLFDGLGQQEYTFSGLLSLRKCWGDKASVQTWKLLDVDTLQKLFDTKTDKEGEISYRLEHDRGLYSEEKKTLVTFYEEKFTIHADYSGSRASAERPATVKVVHKKKTLAEVPVTTDSGTVPILIDTTDIPDYKGKVILKVQLVSPEGNSREKRLNLHLCGEQRQSFVISSNFDPIEPPRKKDTPETEDEDVADTDELDQPAYLYIFSTQELENRAIQVDEDQEMPLVEFKPGIYRTNDTLNPAESPYGQSKIKVELPNGKAVAILEAQSVRKGEFTLEDELRDTLTKANKGKLGKLLGIFSGSDAEPYSALGQIDDITRQRIFLSRLMEAEDGWKPILLDFQAAFSDPVGQCTWIRELNTKGSDAFRNLQLGEAIQNLLDKYSTARKEVLQLTTSYLNVSQPKNLNRPIYAAFPLFVENKHEEAEKRIGEYLDAYIEILKYLLEGAANASWAEAFILTYLDTVVSWDNDKLHNAFFLLGPWHPLVLAKRYLLQANLYRSAKKHYTKKLPEYGNHKLAVLLDKVNAFRWLFHLKYDQVAIEHSYVSAVSDPGWLLAVNIHTNTFSLEHIVGILKALRTRLGIESSILPLSNEDMAEDYLADFLNSHPTKRHLSARIKSGYSAQKIIDSVTEMLYEKESEGLTEIGKLLPGGAHIFFEELPSEVNPIPWKNPPICIYTYGKDEECYKSNPNINLVLYPPVRKMSFATTPEKVSAPRGVGDQAIFYSPVMRLVEGAAATPASTFHEVFDGPAEGDTLGSRFMRALAQVAMLTPTALNVSFHPELPYKLDCPWTVIPGLQLDPAIFIKYIEDGYSLETEDRALWKYNIGLQNRYNTYFIISKVPSAFRSNLRCSPVLEGKDISKDIVRELGHMGIAIGSETMKTGERALGVLGLIGAARLFYLQSPGISLPLRNDDSNVGFMISVDSFQEFLGRHTAGEDGFHRADLVAMQLSINEHEELGISACAIECKSYSEHFPSQRVEPALAQARKTYERLKLLVEAANKPDGIPERLALLQLVNFGLRVSSKNNQSWQDKERKILSAVLQGKFKFIAPSVDALLVTTEGQIQAQEAGIRERDGWWIRLAKGNWPGITEGPELALVREKLARLFLNAGSGSTVSREPLPTQAEELAAPALPEAQVSVENTEDEESNIISTVNQNPGTPVATLEKPASQASAPVPAPSRISPILLGVSRDKQKVFYDPQSAVSPLENYNIMVTGSSGKGKTQFLKSLICNLRQQGINVLILDFKNDFADDKPFLRRADLQCQYVYFDGLPYNPLSPMPKPHPQTGELTVNCGEHIIAIANVLKDTYGLGAQQEVSLKNAIREAYQHAGINPSGVIPYSETRVYPDFNNIGQALMASNLPAYNRLDPLFDLGIFRDEYRKVKFQELLGESHVIDLSSIQSDPVKNALAKIITISAHGYYNSQKHTSNVRQFFVFDEAHRVLNTEYLARFVRECRAYGVGIILSSQYPSDFEGDILNSLTTRVIHGNGPNQEKVKQIIKILGYKDSEETVAGLDIFEALISNKQHNNELTRTFAYPQYIVYNYIAEKGQATLDELGSVEGLDANRLAYTLGLLKKMGLVEEVNDRFQILDNDF